MTKRKTRKKERKNKAHLSSRTHPKIKPIKLWGEEDRWALFTFSQQKVSERHKVNTNYAKLIHNLNINATFEQSN